jgi:membrane associated rhomboid family serine protease
LFNGFLALGAADVFQSGGVAWWAHIGGFVFGLAIVRLIAPRDGGGPYVMPPRSPRIYLDRY